MMRDATEKEYWERNYRIDSSPNEIFLDGFDARRLELLSPLSREGISLEVGAGRGVFAKAAEVDVVVDISLSALHLIKKIHSCHAVVANASNLPFRDGTFARVHCNDVLHHLKGEGILEKSCQEIQRVLRPGGVFLVCDRLPGAYYAFILAINRFGRALFQTLARRNDKQLLLHGSEVEPRMTKKDYAIIRRGYEVTFEKKWRHWLVFWVYGGFHFLALWLNREKGCAIAARLTAYCLDLDHNFGDWAKIDICLGLRVPVSDSPYALSHPESLLRGIDRASS